MHALLVGASGATGKDLLNLLLHDTAFSHVTIFVRRPIELQHDKLTVHVIDFDKVDEWRHLVKGDVLFSCFGTTLKTAGSKQAQWKIDFEYQYKFAEAAKAQQVQRYVLVSSAFAHPKAFLFYPRMKGQLEEVVKALKFQMLAIFNPPTLIRKGSDRPAEVTGIKIMTFLNKLGLFHSQKPMPTEVLATAMIVAAKSNTSGVFTYSAKQIWTIPG